MATVTITGGTGMIGTALTKSLVKKGYDIIILTRNNEHGKDLSPRQPQDQKTSSQISYVAWDIPGQYIDPVAIGSADYIIHLAGAGIADKRWTAKRKKEIVDSRVQSGELLVKKIGSEPNKIKAIIGASAIGWYGADPQVPNPNPFEENAPAASDFLGDTCKKWEASLQPLIRMDKRVVHLRTGIVLADNGGALDEFRKFLKFGLATIPANGKQVMSWIHLDDLVNLYTRAIEDHQMKGAYNAVSPNPVPTGELVKKLARTRNGKLFLPLHVPAFAMKTVLGEVSQEVLKSTTVSCRKIRNQGYEFKFAEIDAALKDLHT